MKKSIYLTVLTICMFVTMLGGNKKTVHADSAGIVISNITSTSAYADWSGLKGIYAAEGKTVTGYDIEIGSQVLYSNTTATAATITGLEPGTWYALGITVHYRYDNNESFWGYEWVGFDTLGSGGGVDGGGSPVVPQNPQPQPTVPGNTNPTQGVLPAPSVQTAKLVDTTVYVVAGNVGYCEGLEFQIIDEKTKKVVKTETAYTYGTQIYNVKADRIYSVQVRAFAYDSNYDTVYSAWSGKKYMVAQPTINTKKSKLKSSSMKICWKKITGAKNYTVYVRKKGSKKWTKITTTKKTTYTIKKIKGKKVNLKKTDYEVSIVANARISGKTVKSDNSKYIYTYTYYR